MLAPFLPRPATPRGGGGVLGPGKARPQNQRRGRGPRPLAAPLRALCAPAAPPRDAAVSCALPAHPFPQHPRYRFDFLYPLCVPPPFPLRNPPYPKSLLETAEGGFQGRAIRSPWRSAPCSLCHPGRGPLPFRSPLPLRNFSGVWGRSRPQPGVQGRGRPWPWRSQYHKVSPTQSLSEFTPIPLPTHKKAPFGAVA